MRLPKFTGSRWSLSVGIVMLVSAAALFLVGCTATADKSGAGVEFGDAMATTGEAMARAGREVSENSGGNPLTTLLGSILTIGGTLLSGAFVSKKIAKGEANKAVAVYDAAPETVAFAKDGSQVPVAPKQ